MLFRGEASVLDILNESTYIQPTLTFSPKMIPLMSLDEDTQLIDYEYLRKMMSDIGVSLDEAKLVIAEANGIDASTIVTSIPEYEMILNPTLREDVGNFVLTNIPTTSDVYLLCEACVSLYEETMDETFLHLLMEDSSVDDMFNAIKNDPTLSPKERAAAYNSLVRVSKREEETAKRKEEKAKEEEAKRAAALEQGKKDAVKKKEKIEELTKQQQEERANRGIFHSISKAWDRQSNTTKNVIKGGVAAAAITGMGLGIKSHIDRLKRIKAEAANAPRTVLAKKIASLRGIYQNYLNRARMERSQHRAGIFKTIASKILGVIDFLLKKLQHAVN